MNPILWIWRACSFTSTVMAKFAGILCPHYYFVVETGLFSSSTRSVPRMAPKAAVPTDNVFVPYLKPEKVGRLKTVRNAIYDPKNHAIFGRTLQNWGKFFISAKTSNFMYIFLQEGYFYSTQYSSQR